VNEDGSGLTALTRFTDDLEPAWSPDGSKIAFAGLRDDVFLMNPDGSGAERVTRGPGFNEQPAWSPDGTRIVFISTRGSAVDCGELCSPELFIMNADGTDVVRVFDAPFSTLDPSTAAI
jgi:Tol biopolymer transport system component